MKAVDTSFSFDLVDEPWVPVIVDGGPARASLRRVVGQPDTVDGIDLADPLAAIAVLRQVLLPLWWDALGLPDDDQEWLHRWQHPRDGADRLQAYLEKHRDRFDLFDDVAPFAQVAELRTAANEVKPVSVLLPDLPTGNNVPLFAARTESDPPALPPRDAILALLVAQCFDTAAIKSGAVGDPATKAGKTTGNPTGPVGQFGVLVPLGATLAETLALNTPLASATDTLSSGQPGWRRPPATAAWAKRDALGLLDLLTWSSRRVRLVPERDHEHDDVVVRTVVLTAGDRLRTPPDYEPHTGWKQNPKPAADAPPQRPARHPPGRATWRGMQALLATRQPTSDGETSSLLLRQLANLRAEEVVPPDLRLQVLAAQIFYGNQSAVVEDVVVDVMPLPVASLPEGTAVRELLVTMAGQARQLQLAANRLGDAIREAAGGDRIPWNRSQRLGDTLVQDLTPTVRRVLSGLQREPQRVGDARAAWREVARRRSLDVAEPVLSAAPAVTFAGRTLKQGGKEYTARLSTAERAYRYAIRDALGSPSESVPIDQRHNGVIVGV